MLSVVDLLIRDKLFLKTYSSIMKSGSSELVSAGRGAPREVNCGDPTPSIRIPCLG